MLTTFFEGLKLAMLPLNEKVWLPLDRLGHPAVGPQDARLVRGRADRRRRLYRVDAEGLERLRSELDTYWDPALAALKDAAETGGGP